jgi:uncharacterized membrane protein YfhO
MKSKRTRSPVYQHPPTALSEKPPEDAANPANSFENLLNRYGLYIFLFLLILAALLVFKDFLLLNKLYLYKDIGSDSININYPGMFHVAEYLRTIGIPMWSFNQGMGQNIFPGSISDPFSLILMLIGGNRLAYGIAYMELCKIICAGLLFFLFLNKRGLTIYAAILGGFLYSFSGFVVLGSCWNIFSTEAIYFALLLYSFEKLYQDKKWVLFPVSVSLIAINQPFDLFLFGLFMAIYVLFRLSEDDNFNLKPAADIFLKIIGLGALGVAISSFFTIADIIQMLQSPRVGGDASYFGRLISKPILGFEGEEYGPRYFLTVVMRFFSSDMLGTGSNFKGWYNYLEAPLFYCGLINLLLLPQVFQFLDLRKKISYLLLLAVFVIPVIFPFFRYCFWGFTGDYYRLFSLFVVFVLLLTSLRALSCIDKNGKINLFLLITSLAVLLIVLYFPYKSIDNTAVVNRKLQVVAAVFLIIYTFLICLLKFRKTRPFVQPLLLAAVLVELVYFSGITVNDRPVVTGVENRQKVGYNDYTIDAVNYLNTRDKSFFRVNKNYGSGLAIHRSINDAKVQNFNGTPSYNSFNQPSYIRFLEEMNIIDGSVEAQTRWAPGVSGALLLHAMASVKYSLVKKNASGFLAFGYDSIYCAGDVKILQNRYFLPLGYTYDKFVRLIDFRKLVPEDRWIIINKACVIDDSNCTAKGIPEFRVPNIRENYSLNEFAIDIAALKRDTLTITRQTQNNVSGIISINNTKMLFFSIPFDNGWSAIVDGRKVKPILANIGFTGLLLEKGEHHVDLTFRPRYFECGAIVSAVAITAFFLLTFRANLRRRKQVNEAVGTGDP